MSGGPSFAAARTVQATSTSAAGLVQGKVKAAGAPLRGSFVYLVEDTSGAVIAPSGWPALDAAGRYAISGVPAGAYRAVFRPDPSVPLAVETYPKKPGFDMVSGSLLSVADGVAVTNVNFSPATAGFLRVVVAD